MHLGSAMILDRWNTFFPVSFPYADESESFMLVVTPRIQIPDIELEFSFARSSGPGGQNVNKVNSKAILSWNFSTTSSLPLDVQERFLAAYAGKLTTDGRLVIAADESRDQARNMEICLEKLAAMLKAVAVAPKKRKPTKPSRAAKEKRISSKKKHGDIKKGRQKIDY